MPNLLGTGGSGRVYQGVRIEDGLFVAIKVVNLEKVDKGAVDSIMVRSLIHAYCIL